MNDKCLQLSLTVPTVNWTLNQILFSAIKKKERKKYRESWKKMKDINRNLALLPAFLKPLKTSNGKI